MAITLSLPVPLLVPSDPVLMLEDPINVSLAPVSYSDGVAVAESHVGKGGIFVYRTAGASGGEEIWNDQEKSWQAALADVASLQPLPFSFKQGESHHWQTVLVAMGIKDKSQQDQFGKASGGFPRYSLRAFMQVSRDGQAYQAISAPSAAWTFVSGADNARFAMQFGSNETPKNATQVRMLLKTPALTQAGYVDIRSAGGNAVEIAACDGSGNPLARIVLLSSGEIRLSPAAGQKLVIDSDVEVGKVFYQPFAGGVKKWLT